jgi:hypothetical protein
MGAALLHSALLVTGGEHAGPLVRTNERAGIYKNEILSNLCVYGFVRAREQEAILLRRLIAQA